MLDFLAKNDVVVHFFNYFELTDEIEQELETYINDIEKLISNETIPDVLNKPKCKKCAYYEYCYI